MSGKKAPPTPIFHCEDCGIEIELSQDQKQLSFWDEDGEENEEYWVWVCDTCLVDYPDWSVT